MNRFHSHATSAQGLVAYERTPQPELAPFVKALWHSDVADTDGARAPRELSLPTGTTHLVMRLTERPIEIFDDLHDPKGRFLGHAVLSGARASFHVKDSSTPSTSIGVEFRTGGAAALFGLRNHGERPGHIRLEELWPCALRVRECLLDAADPASRLERLEEALTSSCRRSAAPHPAIADAASRLELEVDGVSIDDVRRDTGYSHRRFIELFRSATGLTPKLFSRIRRFQRAVASIAAIGARARVEWSSIALDCGYFDQSHMIRDFRMFAGLTPSEYRASSIGTRPNHVPIGDGRRPAARSNSSKRETMRRG